LSARQCPVCHCANDSMTEVAGDLHCLACGYVADVPMEAWDECEGQKDARIAALEAEKDEWKAIAIERIERCDNAEDDEQAARAGAEYARAELALRCSIDASEFAVAMHERASQAEAENTELRKQNEILSTTRRLEEEAREQAEAEQDDLIRQRDGWYKICAKLEAERDALRCCGNCGYRSCKTWYGGQGSCIGSTPEPCHFNPSRWAEMGKV